MFLFIEIIGSPIFPFNIKFNLSAVTEDDIITGTAFNLVITKATGNKISVNSIVRGFLDVGDDCIVTGDIGIKIVKDNKLASILVFFFFFNTGVTRITKKNVQTMGTLDMIIS